MNTVNEVKQFFKNNPQACIVQGEHEGIPNEPTICMSLDEVKETIIELAVHSQIRQDFPNFNDEIRACKSVDEVDEHEVLTNWEQYDMLVRFFGVTFA